jgi:hypothetical protein
MLEAVARERLVKTQQAGKGLAGAVVVICKSVEISDSTVIACSSEWCVHVVNKSIHQSITRL